MKQNPRKSNLLYFDINKKRILFSKNCQQKEHEFKHNVWVALSFAGKKKN